ncbi:MAG: hypothetical protein KJ077_07635 [Anaerolineae bacterium]|nr:hypothetical protein [Anaerolineae bacterium]
MKAGFTPISLQNYVKLHLKANRGAKREEITQALERALQAYKRGGRCYNCGQPIWVIGSALMEMSACFTCVTGEAFPKDEYEIDQAIGDPSEV